MTINIAINHLRHSGNFHVENGGLVRENLLGDIRHYFNSSFHAVETKKIVTLVLNALKTAGGDAKQDVLKFADAFIARNGSRKCDEKILKTFDRRIHAHRQDTAYAHPANLSLLQKWRRAEQPEEIFHRFPAFAEFLSSSKLLSQIKVTRDTLRIIDDEPAMLVEGVWTKASLITERFSAEHSLEYNDTFVVDKTYSVYTYLDNGQGLQKYHPFLSAGTPSISVLNHSDLARVAEKAREFIRPEESSLSAWERRRRSDARPNILQIVSSYTDRGNSNLSKTLRNGRHAYLRLVAGQDLPEYGVKKGHVYEFGFTRKKELLLPMTATQGRFRSPDPWEYTSCDSRFVTNIPISDEEASQVLNYTLSHHRRSVELGREIGFQIAQQNCIVFVREAAKQAGIEVPTEIALPSLIDNITPSILKTLGNQIAVWFQAAKSILATGIRLYTPKVVSEWTLRGAEKAQEAIHRALEMYTAFVLSPLRALLGGFNGDGGESLEAGQEKLEAPSWNLRNLFDLSSYRYNLPCILQNWQRQQASTVEYNNPVRLTIAP